MKSLKCTECGLTNWSTVSSCKRCGASLGDGNVSADNRQAQGAHFQTNQPQALDSPAPPQVKNERLVSFGVLLIILGGILTALNLGAIMRSANWPLYYAVLGASILGSGIVFCMKEWAAVYVYLIGFALAALVMFMTEGMVQKPLARLAGPAILGLFLLNKMVKSKKASALSYTGQ
jgi:hypothetical protein